MISAGRSSPSSLEAIQQAAKDAVDAGAIDELHLSILRGKLECHVATEQKDGVDG